jgi:hypothetical protein
MDLSTVDKLLTTTRTVRKRLDFTRSVDSEIIQTCLEIAIQASTGGKHPALSLCGGDRRRKTYGFGCPLQTGILRGVLATAASGGQPIRPPLNRVCDVSRGAYARSPCDHHPLCRSPTRARDGTRSLCQHPACHLVAHAGTPCSWGGVSMDDAPSPLRAGSSGAPGHPRGYSPSGTVACGVLHGGGLQTRETCACP